jgi:DNA-nicking Smr family endonuclease
VLRKHLPGWLGEPDLRVMVAGLSPADPHHGGEGAVYVALKRRSK